MMLLGLLSWLDRFNDCLGQIEQFAIGSHLVLTSALSNCCTFSKAGQVLRMPSIQLESKIIDRIIEVPIIHT